MIGELWERLYPARCEVAGWMRRFARMLDDYPVEILRRVKTADGEVVLRHHKPRVKP